jgi:hypothetical protein
VKTVSRPSFEVTIPRQKLAPIPALLLQPSTTQEPKSDERNDPPSSLDPHDDIHGPEPLHTLVKHLFDASKRRQIRLDEREEANVKFS